MFGLKPHESVNFWWGARAIYEDFNIDLLWDRQQITGGTEEERKSLAQWLDNEGLPALRKLVKSERLGRGENRLVNTQKSGYWIMANPKASHGYIYISAGKVSNE